MHLNHIFSITDLPRGLGLNFFSLVFLIAYSAKQKKKKINRLKTTTQSVYFRIPIFLKNVIFYGVTHD